MTAEDFVDLFDPAAKLSWAEIELRTAVCGAAADAAFCRMAVVTGAILYTATRTVAEGILSSAAWECVRRDEGIVDDVFQLFLPESRRFEAQLSRSGVPPVRELADGISVAFSSKMYFTNAFFDDDYIQPVARKYMLLDAVERRFPALPVKYYAANARRIHETDEELAVWIKQRLAERAKTSDAFRKIYESMAAEFVDNHLAAAVFMK